MIDENLCYQQETDFHIIDLLIADLKYQTFIDIGAEKGTFAKFLLDRNLTGTLFEPLPKHATHLLELTNNGQTTFFRFAIDNTDREAEFHIANDNTGQPLDYFHSLHRLDNDQRIQHTTSIPVICRSLQSLYQEKIIPKNVGILKTDTEGNDLHVLQGLGEVQPEVILCEYFMPGIYAGWEQGNPLEIIKEARKYGFEHFIAVKRFDNFEALSIDNDKFNDKQWGNLIFINSELFLKAKAKLEKLTEIKNLNLIDNFQSRVEELGTEIKILRDVCQERLDVINRLNEHIHERKKNPIT